MTERYDRNTRGFDFISASPIEAQAKAAYAASPIAEVTAANFNVKGGYQFLGGSNRGNRPARWLGCVHGTVYHLWQ
jgi:hypothetical protein